MSVAVRYAGFSLATTLSVAGFIMPAPQMRASLPLPSTSGERRD